MLYLCISQVGRIVYIKQTITVESTITDPTVPVSAVTPSTVTTIDWGWSVIVDMEKKNRIVDRAAAESLGTDNIDTSPEPVTVSQYFVNCLVYATVDKDSGVLAPTPMTNSKGTLAFIQVTLQDITVISAARLQMPQELKQPSSKSALAKSLHEVITHTIFLLRCSMKYIKYMYIQLMYMHNIRIQCAHAPPWHNVL
jgi:rRNA-processing arch domain